MDTLYSALRVLTRRKLSTCPGDSGRMLQQSLSIVDITCLGLSTTLGTGIFTILTFAAKENAGPSVVLSFLIAAVASCMGGLCYSELTSRFPSGGPAYVYAYSTLGELPAFLIGWTMVFEYLVGSVLAAKALTQYLNVFIFAFGIILTKNLKISCILNNVLVFLCFLVVGGVVLVSMYDMDAENWTAGPGFFPNGVAGVASTCFFSFRGYDIIGSLACETQHKIRIVPLGISLAFFFGLLACFTSSVSITLLVPTSLIDTTAPLIQAFEIRSLKSMTYFVIIGAVTGLTASLLASLLALSRLLFSLANDGLLMSCLSRTYHQIDGPTSSATVVSCVLASVIAMFVQIDTLITWIGMGTLIAYASVALSILLMRYGQIEKLPFESTELMSRDESTCSDLNPENVVRREITRSVSDCYLNRSFAECMQCNFFSDAGIRQQFHNLAQNYAVEGKIASSAFIGDVPPRYNNYGSTQRRSMAVEFVNHSYVTSLASSYDVEKRIPTKATASRVTGLLVSMMLAMLCMGLFTIHVPRLFPHGNEWWLELVATLIFICVTALVISVVQQPKHRSATRNSIPCVPLLPIFAIWMDIHLAVCLPSSAWLAFVIWGLIGIFVYMSYSVWHSKESNGSGCSDCNPHADSNCEECYALDEPNFGDGDDQQQELVQQLDDESDDGSSV